MMESVRAESRDRARSTQIGIACELRCKPGGAVPELTMDGGPRIRAGLGDPGLPGLHHPAFCNPLPAARDGPLTDGAAACEYTMRFVRVPELTAEPARQRDEPPRNPMVRYRSSSCQANITFDADRSVTPAGTIANAPGEAADQGLSRRRNGPAAVLALPMRTCPGYPVTCRTGRPTRPGTARPGDPGRVYSGPAVPRVHQRPGRPAVLRRGAPPVEEVHTRRTRRHP
jgi:hypothetical protein